MVPHVMLCVYIYIHRPLRDVMCIYIYIIYMVVVSLTTYVDSENMSLTAPCASPNRSAGLDGSRSEKPRHEREPTTVRSHTIVTYGGFLEWR